MSENSLEILETKIHHFLKLFITIFLINNFLTTLAQNTLSIRIHISKVAEPVIDSVRGNVYFQKLIFLLKKTIMFFYKVIEQVQIK